MADGSKMAHESSLSSGCFWFIFDTPCTIFTNKDKICWTIAHGMDRGGYFIWPKDASDQNPTEVPMELLVSHFMIFHGFSVIQ